MCSVTFRFGQREPNFFMARISATQNQSLNLKRLVAQRHLYSRAKWISCIQSILVFAIPLVAMIATALHSEGRHWGTLACLVAIPIEGIFLEWLKRQDRERAATIQEDFDCAVLELPWNEVLAGCRPTEEEIHTASMRAGQVKEDCLEDWYPTVVSSLPLHQARIICQRFNCTWDRRLRNHFRIGIWAILTVICIAALVVGIWGGLYTHELVVYVLAPVSPTLLWAVREARQQRAAEDGSQWLQCRLTALLERTVRGEVTEAEATCQSRELQNKILLFRSACPPVFDWIYWWSRKDSERAMGKAAAEIVTQIESSHI